MVAVLCFCSLSPLLSGPTYEDETGAARLQWRQEKTFSTYQRLPLKVIDTKLFTL